MATNTTKLTQELHSLGLTALDWVNADKFAELTGIAKSKLQNRKDKYWPEDLVWTKQDGNIYYSIKGYNQWMTEQARSRYLKASGLETGRSKSTGNAEAKRTNSRSPTPRLQRASKQLLKLDAS